MLNFNKVKKQRDNTAKLAYAFAGVSFLSMYVSMSDGKYDTVDFCFIPEVLHSTPRENFCQSGKDVFRTSPKFLLKKDEFKPNPEFVTGTDKYLIPASGRVIKNYNRATNPNYLWYALGSVALSTTAYGLFSLTNARFKREFPVIFEQYKTETFQAQFTGEQTRDTFKFRTTLETDYIQKGIGQEFQQLEMLNMSDDEKFQYQLFLSEQHQKQKALDDAAYDLQLSQVKAQKKGLELESKTAEKKMERLDKNGYEPGLENQNNSNPGANSTLDTSGNSVTDNNVNDFDVSKSEQETLETVKRIAKADNSTVLVGDPGSGKSSLTSQYIREVRTLYPDGDFNVLAIKNDSFCGLNELECVTRFVGDERLLEAESFFQNMKQEYDERLKLPESDRKSLKPAIYILDDWLSISSALNKADLTVDFGQILFDVLIVGREFNMKWFCNLHSLNLKAIGIDELDSSTRACLNMIILGNRYKNGEGREIDCYKVLDQALTMNQAIPDKKDREMLREKFRTLKEQSRKLFKPLMFGYYGEYFLGLVPYIEK